MAISRVCFRFAASTADNGFLHLLVPYKTGALAAVTIPYAPQVSSSSPATCPKALQARPPSPIPSVNLKNDHRRSSLLSSDTVPFDLQ